MGQFLRTERGSSLIEVIVALTVLSVISLSFMHYFYQAEQSIQVSDRKLIAANLARQEAEKWKQFSFHSLYRNLPADSSALTLFDQTYDVQTNPETIRPKQPNELAVINGTTYHTIVSVIGPDDPAYLGLLLKADVTVFWHYDSAEAFQTAADKTRISSTVETYITREDLRR